MSKSSHDPSSEPPSYNAKPDTKAVVITLGVVALLILLASLSIWLLSFALIFACGIYVAFEFALVQASLRELERDAAQEVPGAAALLKMKREMNAMLAACQFGITLSSLALTLALEPAISHQLHALPFYKDSFLSLNGVSHGLAMGLGAFLHVTFGELIPKGLALVVPRQVLYVTATYMGMFRFISIPFIKTCNSIANLVVRTLTGKDPDKDAHHGEVVEIDEALLMAHAQGRIVGRQLHIMKNVLNFAHRSVREVMTPAREVVSLDISESWDENFKVAQKHGFSRFPVHSGDPHDIIGYIRRDGLLNASILGKRDLKALLLPIERRPETAPLQSLNLFRGAPLVACYDEYDSFSGLLTSEDVIEQILGEIYDDTDDLIAKQVERREDGSIWMDGGLLLDVAGEQLGLDDLEQHQDVDTIGGLILKLLAVQPTRGDRVPLDGWTAIVENARGFRILSLVFVPRSPEDEPAPDDVA